MRINSGALLVLAMAGCNGDVTVEAGSSDLTEAARVFFVQAWTDEDGTAVAEAQPGVFLEEDNFAGGNCYIGDADAVCAAVIAQVEDDNIGEDTVTLVKDCVVLHEDESIDVSVEFETAFEQDEPSGPFYTTINYCDTVREPGADLILSAFADQRELQGTDGGLETVVQGSLTVGFKDSAFGGGVSLVCYVGSADAVCDNVAADVAAFNETSGNEGGHEFLSVESCEPTDAGAALSYLIEGYDGQEQARTIEITECP